MTLRRIELVDFRIFQSGAFTPEDEGTTVITGPNGTGKTSVLEAMVYLSTQRSFRGAPREAMVRTGGERAIIRAELQNDNNPTLVEAEIVPTGRSRTQINRKVARTRKDLAAATPCTIFSPEDLALVSGGPSLRRDLLDDALSLIDTEGARAADEVDRVLRQRAALLRQAGGRVNADVITTLDVWDQRLADAGKILVAARERLVIALAAYVGPSYSRLAGVPDQVVVGQEYLRSWPGDLLQALQTQRNDDLRRGVNTVGPHRDDLLMTIDGREARTHASQGEQRCLALALRIGVHQLVVDRTDMVPTLLLDDVFSELDPARSRALVAELPTGQSILTTASPLPEGIAIAQMVHIDDVVHAG
ncbi:MAG TPA: DNA replication and repair protein RecF [Acidimicrobiales bacterium]|nr:DNA replication and repair protein RecF [Acidimicrobiales bacterium]